VAISVNYRNARFFKTLRNDYEIKQELLSDGVFLKDVILMD
jgi:hypothetical protein